MKPLSRRPSPASMSWVLLTLLALNGTALAGEVADNFDILGFRLGMTSEEVESVFRSLNPEVELQIRHGFYSYSDGLRNFQTEAFLDQISGMISRDSATSSTLTVTVLFSPPPEGGRVMQISRRDSNIANPVTATEYEEALVAKYGASTREQYGLEWHFPQQRDLCTSSASGPVAGTLSSLATGHDREQKLADPSQCASYLVFRTTGDPVRRVEARLVDVENAIRAHLAASAWVADLEAQAVARRQAQGRRPEL